MTSVKVSFYSASVTVSTIISDLISNFGGANAL